MSCRENFINEFPSFDLFRCFDKIDRQTEFVSLWPASFFVLGLFKKPKKIERKKFSSLLYHSNNIEVDVIN